MDGKTTLNLKKKPSRTKSLRGTKQSYNDSQVFKSGDIKYNALSDVNHLAIAF